MPNEDEWRLIRDVGEEGGGEGVRPYCFRLCDARPTMGIYRVSRRSHLHTFEHTHTHIHCRLMMRRRRRRGSLIASRDETAAGRLGKVCQCHVSMYTNSLNIHTRQHTHIQYTHFINDRQTNNREDKLWWKYDENYILPWWQPHECFLSIIVFFYYYYYRYEYERMPYYIYICSPTQYVRIKILYNFSLSLFLLIAFCKWHTCVRKMVGWNEKYITYISADKALFSNYGFKTFTMCNIHLNRQEKYLSHLNCNRKYFNGFKAKITETILVLFCKLFSIYVIFKAMSI